MCLAGHDEHGGLRVVAFEALTEVRLVQLDGHACLGTQYGRVSADALDDALAHEERGLQAYSATLGALAQAQAIHEAFEEPHPYARFELAHAHHPVRANAERPVAVHALPTLGAVTSTPFADDADAAAAHARLHPVRVARRRVQREPLVQGGAQRLDSKVALLRRQFAQFLPDPIDYTRHLARSHTTIVATQQLQYKSKSQPWSNRANNFLKLFGLDPVWWLQADHSLWAVIIANIWLGIPFNLVILYSGLQNINGDLYEAAALDGCNAWQRFWKITFPLLKPVSMITLLLGFVYTLRTVDIIWIMTKGTGSSRTLATWAYEMAFGKGTSATIRYSEASVVGTILIVVALIFALIYLWAQRNEEKR